MPFLIRSIQYANIVAGVVSICLGQKGAAAQPIALPETSVTSPSPILTRPGTPPLYTQDYPVGVLPVVTDTYSSVTVVPRADIIREQPRTLGDALFDKPGISATTYAPGGASRPIIRGLDSNRVRIQENGVGVHDVSNLGEDHAIPVNPLIADQIEVIRGPATLRYGSQAIGGVVSVDNNRIPTLIPIGGITGQVLGGLSSVDRGRNAAASVEAGGGNVAVHADGFKSASDDYQTPLGRQRNSSTDAQGGSIGASYIFDQGYIGANISHFDSIYHIPGGEAADTFTRLNPKQDKVQIQGEYRFLSGPFEAARIWLNGSAYRHDEIGLDDNGADGIRATFKNRELEGRFELQYVPVISSYGTLTGAIGLQAGRSRLGTSGDAGSLLSPTDSRSIAGFIFEQFASDHGFRLQAAGRIEGVRNAGTAETFPADYLPNGTDPDLEKRRIKFTPVSFSLGALQDLPYGFVASLTGQYVERAPAAPELYSHGSHDAPGTFEIGDPNLKLERARSIEFGLRRAEGPLRLDFSSYYTRYTGFIYRRLTGVSCGEDFDSCGVDTDFRQVVYSQQNAVFYGVDLAGQYDVFSYRDSTFGVSGQFDFVDATFDDKTNVPRIPPYRLGGGLFWRDTSGWFGKVTILHAFSHTETAAFETPTPGYNLMKAELSYTRKFDKGVAGITDITVGLIGDNLLDEQIRNSASFKKDEILLPGRGVKGFVSARF